MSGFRYQGDISSSKSMFNRALLVQSFFPQLKIKGFSNCADVHHMQKAINGLMRKTEIDCGEAGMVFRTMALRASREAGSFALKGTPRLLARPQEELVTILGQLGVKAQLHHSSLEIQGQGWTRPSQPLQIRIDRSSQFASAVLLSAWNLSFDLEFELLGEGVSEGYWEMSLQMARDLGMQIQINGKKILIPTGQILKTDLYEVEPDYSSMFSVVAAALVGGQIEIRNLGKQSLQPDFVFVELLQKMGVDFQGQAKQASRLKPLEANLKGSPDLFPVLAALCSFADGKSFLFGASQLVHKESDRLKKTKELLDLAKVPCEIQNDGLVIRGQGMTFQPPSFVFDPDQDHRMAMAAALFHLRQNKIQIRTPQVVEKSFPEFWNIVGIG